MNTSLEAREAQRKVQTFWSVYFQMTKNKQRKGQARMNALHHVNPELHDQIMRTHADCFYDDQRIHAFDVYVFEVLENGQPNHNRMRA